MLLESTVDDRHHGAHTFIPPDPTRFARWIRSLARRYTRATYTTSTVISSSRAASGSGGCQPPRPAHRLDGRRGTAPTQQLGARHPGNPGHPNEVIILTRPTRFDCLHIPDAATNTPTGAIRNTSPSWPPTTFLPGYGPSCGSPRPAHGRGLINRQIIERRSMTSGGRSSRSS